MGNANSPSRGSSYDVVNVVKNYPIKFHPTHSANIQLSVDGRRARRQESFCKGICFSNRPVLVQERVYIKFCEISINWSGVLRFGLTSVDPATVDPSGLPRYACPDLTNKTGYWAKALPERVAVENNVVFFYFTKTGDVYFGVNNEEKGLFLSGVTINTPLWALVDIYGNTKAMEFIDGRQPPLSLSGPNKDLLSQMHQLASLHLTAEATPPPQPGPQSLITHQYPPVARVPWYGGETSGPAMRSMPQRASISGPTPGAAGLNPGVITNAGSEQSLASKHTHHSLPVRFHRDAAFTPLAFHGTIMGKNIVLTAGNTVAIRKNDEFCNAYVFTERSIACGEKIVLQVLGIDPQFNGGLAFGMTTCDPTQLVPQRDLPDDSDLLLDRPEYWVVNKDVCRDFSPGEELSFALTHQGEIVYGRNGQNIATLMHVDKTLPLWAFFDVYGNAQKVKCLGVINMDASGASGLTVALPPPRNDASPSLRRSVSAAATSNPPPRPPPPPRLSPKPGRMTPSPRTIGEDGGSIGRSRSMHRPLPVPPPSDQNPPPLSPPEPRDLPPPLIPMPAAAREPVECTEPPEGLPPKFHQTSYTVDTTDQAEPPAVPPRNIDKVKALEKQQETVTPSTPIPTSGDISQESMENANNECCICLERTPDCVIYTCGHMCMCYECAVGIKRKPGAACPMCRKEIKDIIKIFRS